MTLQSSGAISLADVQTEFGGSNPIGINEYYGVASGVPASGTISLYDFYGKSAGGGFDFSLYVFGYRYSSGYYRQSDSYSGNIITPGSGSSPKTFYIQTRPFGVGSAVLSYYQGGSLNTTWSGFVQTNVTFTFGSSSMQFTSYCLDPNYLTNTTSETSVSDATKYLFQHVHDAYGATDS